MAKTMFFKILNATLSASHMLRYRDQQNIINKKEMEREREGGRKTAAIRLAQHYDIIYNYYINILSVLIIVQILAECCNIYATWVMVGMQYGACANVPVGNRILSSRNIAIFFFNFFKPFSHKSL
uniref:Uncharacterized protein n=2 Tax=Cacopsylla melanoneura TaxID=428564 RepID=A0A8D8W8R5_9HEMI